MKVFNDMQHEKLEVLFQKFVSQTATEAEKHEFFELIRLPGTDPILRELAERYPVPEDLYYELPEQASSEILAAILQSEDTAIPNVHRVPFLRRVRWVAAAIFIIAVAGIVFLVNSKRAEPVIAKVQNDIKAPEKNKATITLPNGKTIMLDTVPNGTLIAGIARKTAEGQLVFEGKTSDAGYITTSNPRNSKAMYIELPDHTEVWLNADTRLQYPTSYNEKDRLITLNGEAYFEVKHNAAKTFRVSAGDQTIEDIGTGFNVKAYGDENTVKTTLLEGVVKINNAVSLKPGQQFSNNKVADANIDEVMAWKNGSFYLDGRELGTVANELGRWYDVDVVFGDTKTKHSIVFGGEMGRNLTILEALELLKGMKVNCRLDGKKLIIE